MKRKLKSKDCKQTDNCYKKILEIFKNKIHIFLFDKKISKFYIKFIIIAIFSIIIQHKSKITAITKIDCEFKNRLNNWI